MGQVNGGTVSRGGATDSRISYRNARIQGLQTDLHLVGFRFNWALTVFYIPYLMYGIELALFQLSCSIHTR